MSRRGTRLPDAPPDDGEDVEHLHESDISESEEEGESIVGEDMDKDYIAKPTLDQYDQSQFDDTNYAPMTANERAAAERELNRQRRRERALTRDRRRGGQFFGNRLPSLLEPEDSEPLSLADPGLLSGPSIASERVREALGSQVPSELGEEGAEATATVGARGEEVEERFDLETIKNPIEEFQQPAPRREMARLFRDFLLSFVPEEQLKEYQEKVDATGGEEGIEKPKPIYPEVLQECKRENRRSIEVDYRHLIKYNTTMASFIIFTPALILPIFDDVVMQIMTGHDDFIRRVTDTINVRISNVFPQIPLTRLRQEHLNSFICTSGVVTRRSGVYSQTTEARFNCETCGTVIGPFTISQKNPIKIRRCPNCDSRGPFRLNNEETVFRNYQRVTLQESPNALEPGRLPRHKDVILVNDLIDCCKPGEEIEVTGIYVNQYDVVLNKQYGFPVFTTQIDANYIKVKSGRESESGIGHGGADMSMEERAEVENFAKQPDITDRVFRSFAPAIYGHEDIKRALCLAMVGGVRVELPGHVVRGDINILMLGDPATAKSQLLKYVEQTGDRVVRTTGRGASAVGLTAAVRRDPTTGEWTLEGGAMVLANNGICVIDEFDKMNDKDRTSIHEAMEQQTISISKAGIVAVLNARCAVIAAANPIHSRYDVTQTFLQNVDLSEPILSRFDLLCVVKDTIDDENDRRMARFIMKSHIMAHPEFNSETDLVGFQQLTDDTMNDPLATSDERLIKTLVSSGDSSSTDFVPLTPTQLRNYIHYARTFQVSMNELPRDELQRLYTDLRQAAQDCGGTPVSARHLDSLLRVSQAYAKLRLHPVVTRDDVQMAIRTVLESFIMSQKYQAKAALRKQFQPYMAYNKDKFVLLRELLKRMESEAQQYHVFRLLQASQAAQLDEEERQAYIRKDLEARGGHFTVEIPTDRFSERARQEAIEQPSVDAFMKSELFHRTGFELVSKDGRAILRKTGVNITDV